MPKHKLTPEIEDAINQYAEALPEQDQAYLGRALTGAELLRLDPNIKDQNGNTPDRNKEYYCKDLSTAINHRRRMRKVYEKGGRPALVNYLVPFASHLQKLGL